MEFEKLWKQIWKIMANIIIEISSVSDDKQNADIR